METLILKEEWAIKCHNCGCDSHCETRTTRTEQQYEVDGGEKYEIDVCRQCRCDACKQILI